MEKDLKNSRQASQVFSLGTVFLILFLGSSIYYDIIIGTKAILLISLVIKLVGFLAILSYIHYKFNEVVLFLKK